VVSHKNKQILLDKNLLADLKNISSGNNDNSNTDPVYDAMIRATEDYIKMLLSESESQMLKRLKSESFFLFVFFLYLFYHLGPFGTFLPIKINSPASKHYY